MVTKKAPRKAPKRAARKRTHDALRDGGENVSQMEPLHVSQESDARPMLSELVLDLTKRSTALSASLPEGLVEPLADFVRSMNCHYSNLIEGHNTHPVDIEKALNDKLSRSPEKRDLQLEAKAHIAVQRWIDEGGLSGRETTVEGILEIHSRFTRPLPDELCWAENPDTGEKVKVVPGEFRNTDAAVGEHICPSPGSVPRFMNRLEAGYGELGDFETILGAAGAHHRLLYIHPFTDGNGRVTRLVSYAMLRKALDSGGLWSIARGLARNEERYKELLATCDVSRRGDRDGRGNLSEKSLVDFTKFFLGVCVDQVTFMEGLMQPKAFRERILGWANEEIKYRSIPAKSPRVLDAILFKGSLPRAEVASVIGQSVSAARNVTNALSKHGIIMSPGPRADWHIAFPAKLAPRIMPGLFPDR